MTWHYRGTILEDFLLSAKEHLGKHLWYRLVADEYFNEEERYNMIERRLNMSALWNRFILR